MGEGIDYQNREIDQLGEYCDEDCCLDLNSKEAFGPKTTGALNLQQPRFNFASQSPYFNQLSFNAQQKRNNITSNVINNGPLNQINQVFINST